jgi:hypothetical protein
MSEKVTVKFHKDVQLNGVLYKAGVITEVPEDYWRTEGHRHGERAIPPAPGVPITKEDGALDQLKTALSSKTPKSKESK